MELGLLTLLPALMVIVAAIMTKRTIEPLLIGGCLSYVLISGIHFLPRSIDAFFSVVTDYDNVWLILVCGMFGSFIALLNAAKATNAIGKWLGKICRTQKNTLFTAWLLGILIFIDDYMNILTISACTKDVSDRHKIPRESLAYVIDSTGAPVCALIPFSTWAIFFAGVFYEQENVRGLGYGNAIETYIHVIPYIFYATFAVIIVPLFILGVIPKLGAMKKAYQRVDATGKVFSEASANLNKGTNADEVRETVGNVWDFVIPIGLLIAVSLIWENMFLAVVVAILSCLVLYVPRKLMKLSEFCDLWVQGFADTIPALAIIVAALFMRQASADLNLPTYVINLAQPFINAKTFPMIAFIIVACLGFITGSNWGIPAVCAPIIIPLGASVNANILLLMAAIVAGGTFSSHACFYSDATVITSTVCQIDNMDHVKTQMPYALLAMLLSCIAFGICGVIM